MVIHAYSVSKKGAAPEEFFYEAELGNNDVLVRITHCAVTTGDLQLIDNLWGDTNFPLVAGHEIVGLIEELGSDVIGLIRGDRVGIGYQQKACFQCEFCQEGNEQFCPFQKVIAVDCYGGFAQHIIVDARFVFKLPSKLDSAKTTPLFSAGLTVYSAIVRAQLRPKSIAAVIGAGGLGQLAIQFLNKMGHSVSGFSYSPQKRLLIEQAGAEYVSSGGRTNTIKYNRFFDFILVTNNREFDLDEYLRMLKPQGKLCIVAAPLRRLSVSTGILYDYAQRTIFGNYTGSRRDMTDMLAFSEKHNIESNVEVMSFAKMKHAIDLVRDGKVKVRLVLENA